MVWRHAVKTAQVQKAIQAPRETLEQLGRPAPWGRLDQLAKAVYGSFRARVALLGARLNAMTTRSPSLRGAALGVLRRRLQQNDPLRVGRLRQTIL